MTIVRIGQLTAEDRTLTALNQPVSGGVPTISSVQKKTGIYSYRGSTSPVQFGLAIPTPVSSYRLGYWLRHNAFETANQVASLYRAANGSDPFESENIKVHIDPVGGTLDIRRPTQGTVNTYETLLSVGIPASLQTVDSWKHIGITHKIALTDGFLSVYINGIRVLNLIGDTRLYGQGNGTPVFSTTAALIWGAGDAAAGSGGWGNEFYVDDWYLDSYVGELDTPVPARIFDKRLPTVAGANAAWTPLTSTNVSQIIDNPNDGDVSYNRALVANLRDTFQFEDVVVPADHTIIAEIPTVFAKRLDSAIASKISVHAYDGTLYGDSADLDLAMDYSIPVFARLTTMPNGNPWTQAGGDAAQFGYQSRGTF